VPQQSILAISEDSLVPSLSVSIALGPDMGYRISARAIFHENAFPTHSRPGSRQQAPSCKRTVFTVLASMYRSNHKDQFMT
jgi:hypothetical protein